MNVRVFSPDRLREARLAKGWSQGQLARALETSEQNVSRWERGANLPGANVVPAIAHALGREIDFFYVQVGDDEDEKEAALRRKARALVESLDPDLFEELRAQITRPDSSPVRSRS